MPVTCATAGPDWHARCNLAFQAGKDVYGEQPLSYDVKEGQMMLPKYGKVIPYFSKWVHRYNATDNYHRGLKCNKVQEPLVMGFHTTRFVCEKRGPPPKFRQFQKV